MEIWHRINIDGKHAAYWQRRGLKMRPIRSAFYPDGTAKSWVTEIREDDPRWTEVKRYIDGLNFVGTTFGDEERLAAEWCILRGAGMLRPNEPEGGYRSTEYFENKCQVCGSGWTQIAPFRLKREARGGKNVFCSFGAANQLFVTEEVLEVFREVGIRGFTTWPLLVGKDRHPTTTGVQQFLVEHIAAPALAEKLAEREDFRSEDCPHCGRHWHTFYRRGMLPLYREALLTDVDFQLTNEWFGSGRAARREILVSRRVVQLILGKKWRGADLSPAQLV